MSGHTDGIGAGGSHALRKHAPASARRLSFIVPGDLHQPTGGYRYDARIVAGLREHGWTVEVAGLAGRFPQADARAKTALDAALAQSPDGRLVVIDGLALGGLPDIAERHASRLRLIALVHHPLADETGLDENTRQRLLQAEKRAVEAADGVIVTSRFTARRLRALGMDPASTAVVEPGVDAAPSAATGDGSPCRLLCVASLIPRKGHDMLVDALASVRDLDWCCDCVGATDRDRHWTAAIAERVQTAGLGDRMQLHGALSERALAQFYQRADLFVLASHYEGYGMVVAEAVAHGLPVVTTRGGSLGQTLPDGAGMAVAPGDARAFGRHLRSFIACPSVRARLRHGALRARGALRGWHHAADEFAAALARHEPETPAAT